MASTVMLSVFNANMFRSTCVLREFGATGGSEKRPIQESLGITYCGACPLFTRNLPMLTGRAQSMYQRIAKKHILGPEFSRVVLAPHKSSNIAKPQGYASRLFSLAPASTVPGKGCTKNTGLQAPPRA